MSIFKETKKYITGVKTEAKKVSWPSKKTAIKDSFIVIGISLAAAAFLGGIDFALNEIMKNIAF
ncbi:MAG: preprotein translocase subunit SecE [Candidatus Pacebacteria bacterium]|nr:preprotein translocase subunit SecE [Candidatus Paceibacterota bacterium]